MALRLRPESWLGLLVLAAGCATVHGPEGPAAAPAGPHAIVLGTAQDGGLPQIGCRQAPCVAARSDPSRARAVTSLLLVDPRSEKRWLFDASPDLPDQLERYGGPSDRRAGDGARPPLFDGVFLTHAHMGHYTGLLHLGREVYGSRGQAVHGTASMGSFLRTNGPWSLLVESGGIELRTLTPGTPVKLAHDLSVVALEVPHRDEFTDTVAFVVRGPERSLLYLPDIDKWARWDRSLQEVLAEVDVALLDGTFFDGGELPGRNMSEIPHPFIVETIEHLESAPAELRARVLFTHHNHTNPCADPDSGAAGVVRDAGMAVARDGLVIEL